MGSKKTCCLKRWAWAYNNKVMLRDAKERIVILFEGRDAAGNGGTINTFMQHLNPRSRPALLASQFACSVPGAKLSNRMPRQKRLLRLLTIPSSYWPRARKYAAMAILSTVPGPTCRSATSA